MPGITADACAGILERLVLEPGLWQAHCASVVEQTPAAGRHEVRHLAPLPHVTVKPEPAVHRVNHPITALCELDILYGAW
jgi:hypothetical protein